MDHNTTQTRCKRCSELIPMKRKRDQNKTFCGRKCASVYLFSAPIGLCKECGTYIKLNITNTNQRRQFCSRKCANKNKKITHIRICQRCKKEFVLTNIAYEKRNSGKFCSSECGTRKYSFDETYFISIDTEEKAYWLGFLFADGNIYKNQMTLKLQQSDKNHIEKFKLAIKSEHPIHDGNHSTFKHCKFSSFFIGSKKLSQTLISLGMIPKKSLTVEFPKIEKELYKHFIRGYFDGDGCLYVNNNNQKVWSIYSGSEKILLCIKNILEEYNVRCNFRKVGKGYNLYTARKENIKLIDNLFYTEASVFMERKRNKFLS